MQECCCVDTTQAKPASIPSLDAIESSFLTATVGSRCPGISCNTFSVGPEQRLSQIVFSSLHGIIRLGLNICFLSLVTRPHECIHTVYRTQRSPSPLNLRGHVASVQLLCYQGV